MEEQIMSTEDKFFGVRQPLAVKRPMLMSKS